MRSCCVCGAAKNLAEFYRDRNRKDGVMGACKDCINERNRTWRAQNPEKARAKLQRDNQRRRERDPEQMRAYRARYNNSDKGHAARKRYERGPKWRAISQRSAQRTRWPRNLKSKYGITVEEYAWMLYRQGFSCSICGHPFADDVIASTDPRSVRERPNVDHDHSTGRVRGIVCGWCNHSLLGPIEAAGPELVRRIAIHLGWQEAH